MNNLSIKIPKRKLNEECGVFGVYSTAQRNVSSDIYYGLFSLQHRGQESCGIAVNDIDNNSKFDFIKNMGLVSEVFNENNLSSLKGRIGIGHVRYSTAGESHKVNAQPLVMHYMNGGFAISHNGNISNANKLKDEFESNGVIFHTSIDSEVIAYHIAKERVKTNSVEEAIANTMKVLEGSYSLLVMSSYKLIAARDPLGFRPLVIGKTKDSYVFSSETCGLDSIGAEYVRDVLPGEIVIIQDNEIRSIMTTEKVKPNICTFEYIYFARPDSYIEGSNVYAARIEMGASLAKHDKELIDADIVVGVPDSGLAPASGYAKESGLPLVDGFVRNKYIGRTFIKPKQSQREESLSIKLNVVKHLIKDKNVVLVDDSIVRGTTSKRIVRLLKKAGAKKVHMRISSPPVTHSCYFGIDTPKREKLIASNKTIPEIEKYIEADSLRYLTVDEAKNSVTHTNCNFCDACFTGNYLVDISDESNK